MHRRIARRVLRLRVVFILGVSVGALALAAPASAAPPPGTVSGSAPTTINVLGLPLKVQAWRLQYASTDTTGAQETDIATVLLPNVASATAPRPLLSYQVAEDALSTQWAPSTQLQAGTEVETPLILAALEQGWAVVVPDYEGPQSQWTAGVQAGHGVLDAIRAAQSFSPLGLSGSSTPVGLWGYSGGAQASAWAAELQPSYAPELHLAGVAEGGVPVNVGDVARKINGGPFSGMYFGAGIGLDRAYPQLIALSTILNPLGQAKAQTLSGANVEQMVAEGAFQPIQIYTVGGEDPLTLPGVQQAVAADALGQRAPTAPIYLYMSTNDQLLPVADDDALVRTYCGEGVAVDYVKDVLSEHISLTVSGAGAAIDYLRDRFAGMAAPSTCATGPSTTLSTLASTRALITTLTAITGFTGVL
jgi:hypothetical protein